MISLKDVTVSYRAGGNRIDVLSNVSVDFEPGVNIGILGPRGCGKSTLMRLLGSHIKPSSGRVHRSGRVSWPMASMRPIARTLSLRSNIEFLSTLYRVPASRVATRVEEIAGLRGHLDTRADRLPNEVMSRAVYAMCLAMEFDYYLADEALFLGDFRFRERAQGYLDEMRGRKTLIFATRSYLNVRRQCDIIYILNEGRLIKYDDVSQAIEAFKAL
ncbi:ATP-binding cassette domain-containing protein [Labrys wisconsinensis]|uniref:Capsular polysaccharide transport system ATP-binding protein n=1 Tax=Labrys wisconsinensis TaxID=425677 RepID=A0ABU0JGT5_9HYPH|nr:ATP-binding cassette domain-containing protein [Labrys wisconsinensis]MDQ0472337.1 capsular polysaccharide transport system ATP-binding protein [Labrys wisconsinensis]